MAKKLQLQDVQKKLITIVIDNPAIDFSEEIDIELPSMAEWNNDLLTIEWPIAPTLQRMIAGKGKEDYVDYNDAEYLRKRAVAFDHLAMRRITRALIGGGNLSELKAKPLDEAAEILAETGDKTIMQGVNQALNEIIQGMKGGAEAKRAAFQRTTRNQESISPLPETP